MSNDSHEPRDNKSFVEVRLRIDRDLKMRLQEQAEDSGQRLSEYLRERMLDAFRDGQHPGGDGA